jgi:ATP-dependent RNA helicase DHX8/PRP22
LKVIIASATLDAGKFSKFFNDAPILKIPGFFYPVEIFYRRQNENDYFHAALTTAINIHLTEPPGDVLIFLTGQDEIDTACEILIDCKKRNEKLENILVIPMYSALPQDMQDKVLKPAPEGVRKVILSTNIGETSITIDGVKFVIDCGFFKQNVFNTKTEVEQLTLLPISQASANQRTGRAGRTAPGKCYRLYTKESYQNDLLPNAVPEIQRGNLASIILQLKFFGIDDILSFEFLEPPTEAALCIALKRLYLLEALDDNGNLTDVGRRMASLPLEPNLSKMLITAISLKCTDDVTTIVSCLSVSHIFYRPRINRDEADRKKGLFHHPAGDHITMLQVYKAWERNNYAKEWCEENFINEKGLWEAKEMKEQLLSILIFHGIEIHSAGMNFMRIQIAVCAGYFYNVAKRKPDKKGRGKVYETESGTSSVQCC